MSDDTLTMLDDAAAAYARPDAARNRALRGSADGYDRARWREMADLGWTAVIVPEAITHDQLMHHIQAAPTAGLLRSATLFDVYRPKQAGAGLTMGEKSLAVRLVLCDDQATLTDEQIDQAVSAVVVSLQAAVGARLRT